MQPHALLLFFPLPSLGQSTEGVKRRYAGPVIGRERKDTHTNKDPQHAHRQLLASVRVPGLCTCAAASRRPVRRTSVCVCVRQHGWPDTKNNV